MSCAWVLGSGGLLGSAMCRALIRAGTRIYTPVTCFNWNDASCVRSQVVENTEAFAQQLELGERWEIYWAAGIGTLGSSASALAQETEIMGALLGGIGAEPRLMGAAGVIVFASSAGAIYAGSGDFVVTESSAVAPTTAYAHAKLIQEGLVRSFCRQSENTCDVIARLSTVYGPGQSHGKQQGLLASIARRLLTNKPINIFVPLDTVRDYIKSDDAAEAMVRLASNASKSNGQQMSIVASEQPVTIAEIVATFRRVTRRAPRLITSGSKLGAVYARSVRFRSITSRATDRSSRTSLAVGVAQLLAAEQADLMRAQRLDRN